MTLKDLTKLSLHHKQLAHPTVPLYALVPNKYTDKTANGLTKAIIDFIRYNGGYADRINNMGIWKQGGIKDRYHEVLIEKGKWTPSGSRKGIADIMGSFNGKLIAIEVKIGKDKMSEHQLKIQSEVTASGGIYIIARNWADFHKDWTSCLI